MNTKFILHGGFAQGIPQQDNKFFQTMLEDTPESVNILLVYFAREPFDWTALERLDTEQFRAHTDRTIHCRTATLDGFEQELAWADVVFFKGGDGPRLTLILSQYPDLARQLQGKTIGAISAGANALSKYYYSRRGGKILEGLGILPRKIFTHYEKHLSREYQELKDYKEKLEIVTIPEGSFTVIQTD